ncbi:hypothetical protein HaLaN_19458, partial [Haematococcus lacustris]
GWPTGQDGLVSTSSASCSSCKPQLIYTTSHKGARVNRDRTTDRRSAGLSSTVLPSVRGPTKNPAIKTQRRSVVQVLIEEQGWQMLHLRCVGAALNKQ